MNMLPVMILDGPGHRESTASPLKGPFSYGTAAEKIIRYTKTLISSELQMTAGRSAEATGGRAASETSERVNLTKPSRYGFLEPPVVRKSTPACALRGRRMQALLGASTRFLLLKLDQAYEVRLRTRLPGLESHQPSSAASRASPSRGLAAVPHTIAHACKMGCPPCATRDADFSLRMRPASNHPSPTIMHCVHAPWLYPFFSRACSTPVRQGWGESTFGEVEMLGAEQRTSPRSSFESRPSCTA